MKSNEIALKTLQSDEIKSNFILYLLLFVFVCFFKVRKKGDGGKEKENNFERSLLFCNESLSFYTYLSVSSFFLFIFTILTVLIFFLFLSLSLSLSVSLFLSPPLSLSLSLCLTN